MPSLFAVRNARMAQGYSTPINIRSPLRLRRKQEEVKKKKEKKEWAGQLKARQFLDMAAKVHRDFPTVTSVFDISFFSW